MIRHPVPNISRSLGWGLFLALGCGDEQSPVSGPNPGDPAAALPSLVVSNPSAPVAPAAGLVAGFFSSDSTAYLSLAPGSVPGGQLMEVVNRRTGARVAGGMVDGGLDPLAIGASAGDTLEILIHVSGEAQVRQYATEVPDRRHPRVVRTDPPPGKRDVPLNAGLLVVFSEPIDAGALTGTSIELTTGGVAVQGTLVFGDAENLTVRFTPAVPLAAGVAYTLSVTQQLRDLDGDSLEAPLVVSFTTNSTVSPPAPPGTPIPPGLLLSEPAGAGGPVYVALQPYSRAGWLLETVLMQVRRTGVQVSTTTVNGGFDPIVIAAAAGDTLDLTFRCCGSVLTDAYFAVVPSDRPPEIVRSDPPSQRRNVPTDVSLEVVFSEPMDPLTLTASTVHLSTGGTPVAGTISSSGSAHLKWGFTPAAPLAFGTTYTLDLMAGVRDASGDGLAATSIQFVTLDTSSTPPPGSSQILFVRQGQIYQVNLDGSNLVRLSDGPGDGLPVWSPDGARIAFSSDRTGVSGVYLMDADGSNVGLRMSSAWEPSWSPDGQWIAYRGFLFDPAKGYGSEDVYLVPAIDDGTMPIHLTDDSGVELDPAWSPDGSRVAFVADWSAYDFTSDIYLWSPDGSQRAQITNGFGFNGTLREYHQPAWSPDGQRLAAVRCPMQFTPCEFSSEVVVMNRDGSDITALAATNGFARPTWSPDGTTILYASTDSLFWVRANGTNSGLILTNAHSPAWHP